jgi:hypothetical protein
MGCLFENQLPKKQTFKQLIHKPGNFFMKSWVDHLKFHFIEFYNITKTTG